MSILKRFFKDTFIYGLAIVLPRIINFLLVRLHTDNLENEAFSDNTTFYVYAAFFNVFLTYGMETAFFRFFSKTKDKAIVFSTSLIALTVTTLTFGVIVFSLADQIAEILLINVRFFKILVGVTVLETLIVIPFAYLRVAGRPIRFAVLKMINVLVIVLLNILFLSEVYGSLYLRELIPVPEKVEYVFIANLMASIVVFILCLPYFLKSSWKFDGSLLKNMLRYGWPIMVAGFAFVINENLDKWLLPIMVDKATNGSYAACYKLGVFMTLFIQAFRMGAEPFFFNHAKEKNAPETYARILKYFTIVGSIGLVTIIVAIEPLKHLFINESYYDALEIVPYILLANLFLGIYHNLAVWYKLTDKTRYGMYISLIGAAITILFNVVMIDVIGFMACAYATVTAYGTMMLISYFLGRKHYEVPYDVKRIVFYLILSTGLSLISFYQFPDNMWIGTALLCVFLAIIFFLERKELKQVLKS
ncbi:MAG: polysaccharide biosynthesis protein [Flavobacteriaceae bacterium]|nr:polysaccharide biosynthesis protein [Flavobacteriaceae bacterium]